jgi:MerR family Zn(II)-responsive transcriptional regulator of zntA
MIAAAKRVGPGKERKPWTRLIDQNGDMMLIEKLQQTAGDYFKPLPRSLETHLIGELERLVGLEANTIRFYEKAGLIAPERLGRMRVYRGSDISRLQLIRYLRTIGMPLSKIKVIVSANTSGDSFDAANREVQKLLEDHLLELQNKLRELQASIESLKKLVPDRDADASDGTCGRRGDH